MGESFQSGKVMLAHEWRALHPRGFAFGDLTDAKALVFSTFHEAADRPSAAGGGATSLPPSFVAGATSLPTSERHPAPAPA